MRRPAWSAIGLTAAAALVTLAPRPFAAPAGTAVAPRAVDRHGDALPAGAVTRLGTVRFRGPLAAGPQPGTLATLRGNRAVVVEAEGGRLVRRYPGPDPLRFQANSFLLDPDGRSVAYGGEAGLEVYDAAGGQIRAAWPNDATDDEFVPGDYQPIAFLRDGSGLVVQRQSAAGYVDCLDLKTGRLRWRLGQPFPTDDRSFCVAGVRAAEPAVVVVRPHANDAAVWLVSSTTGELGAAFPVSTAERVAPAAVSPDGTQLAVADPEHAIRLHELASGREVRAFAPKQGWLDVAIGQYEVLTFSPDGKSLAATGELGLSVFSTATGRQLFHHGSRTFSGLGRHAGAFAADGGAVWVQHHDAAAWRCYSVPAGRERKLPDHGHRAHITSVAVAPDGKLVATAAGDEPVRLWDGRTGQVVRRLSSGGLFSSGAADLMGFRALAFSPNGALVAGLTSSFSGGGFKTKLVLWEAAAGRIHRSLSLGGDAFADGNVLAFSLDNRLVALAGCENAAGPNGAEHAIHVYDIAAAKARKVIRGLPADPSAIGFSPDGRRLLVANRFTDDGSALIVYDLATGQPWRTGPAAVTAAAFLPHGELIVYATAEGLAVWELASGQERVKLPLPEGEIIDALAVSPEGRWVAGINAGSGMRRLHVWDVRRGVELPALVGHDQVLTAVAFAGGGRLVSGSQDTTALVWQLPAPPSTPPPIEATAWEDLAGDAGVAFRSVEALVAHPAEAVAWLGKHLRAIEPPSAAHVERLLAQLDSRRYVERQLAAAELAALDRQAEPFLLRYREMAASAEAASRVEGLLARLTGPALGGARLRELRAVEVLARIGSPDAQSLLREWAGGDPAARLTEAARSALGAAAR
jgi:WD40 repeat protein